jgi:Domain of unknown function (DUF4404)
MDNKSLKKELEKLQTELKKTRPTDQVQRESLQHLIDDVQSSLASAGQLKPELHASLTDRLTEAIELFEISHPLLTAQMDKLLEILSSAGI